MKIVHLDTGRELRGGQRQLLLLAEGLRRRGHEQVIVGAESSALEALARDAGFRVLALPAHDIGYVFGALLLKQFLAAEPYEVIHAHDGRGQTIAWIATLGTQVGRVASRRVTFLPGGLSAHLRLHRLKYTLTCHRVIAISNYVRGLLVNSGVPGSRIEVVPDGIEVPSELPGPKVRARARAQWGLSDQDFVIGHAGAFTPEKGQDIAIEAMTVLKDRLPKARLLLVGPVGVEGLRLLSPLLDRAGKIVRLLGYVDDLTEFFAALDLYIMPSRAEGLGSSALLAMAHGLPVVASRVGGLPEVVEEGRTGWLVAPDAGGEVSDEALAEAIVAGASDRERLAALGVQARERARSFASDIMVTRTEALYQRLLAE
ncbi:MAG TPA: glycosyltransferase family 4 protein [Terriglobia bacterium]|nr:glycosyltransferase family 4 protein [Terriglobia bacterium]